MQPQIHIDDQTWIAAPVETVSAVLADPANWARWWPRLRLTLSRDRGRKGLQFAAHSRFGGRELGGSSELWLEPFKAGVIVHQFVRLDAIGDPLTARQARRLTRALAERARRELWRLKDELEDEREARPLG